MALQDGTCACAGSMAALKAIPNTATEAALKTVCAPNKHPKNVPQEASTAAPTALPVTSAQNSAAIAKASSGSPLVATPVLHTVSAAQAGASALNHTSGATPQAPPLRPPSLNVTNATRFGVRSAPKVSEGSVATSEQPKEASKAALEAFNAERCIAPVATSSLPVVAAAQAMPFAACNPAVAESPLATPALPLGPGAAHTDAVCRAPAPGLPVVTAAHAKASTITYGGHACVSTSTPLMLQLPTVSAEYAVALARAHAARTAQDAPSTKPAKNRTQRKVPDASTDAVKDPVASMMPMHGPKRSPQHNLGSMIAQQKIMHDGEALDDKEEGEAVDGWESFQKLHLENQGRKNPDATVDELANIFGLQGTKSGLVEATLEGAEELFGPAYSAQARYRSGCSCKTWIQI